GLGPHGRDGRCPAGRRYRAAVLPAQGPGGPAEGAGAAEEKRRPVTTSAEVSFLQDGAQPAEQVAGELADFITAARHRLDIAIYDLNLKDGPADQVRAAVRSASTRGVAIQLLYNVDFPNPIPVPPPSQA